MLAVRFPRATIDAVDISEGMLSHLKEKAGPERFVPIVADMVDYVRGKPDESLDVAFSVGGIGYAQPEKVIEESGRVLRKGGILAFVIWYRDTLRPVFDAVRICMRRFPGRVQAVALPGFPSSPRPLLRACRRAGLSVEHHQDGYHTVATAEEMQRDVLPWLKKTGVLAGFDSMLSFADDPEVARCFDSALKRRSGTLDHHYGLFVAVKQ
jgi:SAM-dependent methyltransferase